MSELSEELSIASYDLSSMSYSASDYDEDMVDNVDNNDNVVSDNDREADQEYTIYEQLPVRKSYNSSHKQASDNIKVSANKVKTEEVAISNGGKVINKSAKRGDLQWITCPGDITTHQGKIVTLMCQVSGAKPIGKIQWQFVVTLIIIQACETILIAVALILLAIVRLLMS